MPTTATPTETRDRDRCRRLAALYDAERQQDETRAIKAKLALEALLRDAGVAPAVAAQIKKLTDEIAVTSWSEGKGFARFVDLSRTVSVTYETTS
jgi:hypothetical protein